MERVVGGLFWVFFVVFLVWFRWFCAGFSILSVLLGGVFTLRWVVLLCENQKSRVTTNPLNYIFDIQRAHIEEKSYLKFK